MLWNLTRPNIQDCFNQKAQEFMVEENQNFVLMIEEWLGRHIYSDIHKYFFTEFSIILYEWLA